MSTEPSILIVDDAKFSAALISKRIKAAGYSDVRTAHDPLEALAQLEERPCELLIADWIMPEMDGIELCKEVRTVNANAHFTYCLLITAKDGDDSIRFALEHGMDDFILKADLNTQLLPRVLAGLRISASLNSSIQKQAQMQHQIDGLTRLRGRDETTGLGTSTHAEDAVIRIQRHAESRGGATSYMTVQLRNWQAITNEYPPVVCKELSVQIANKIKSLVRPLDEVCRLAEDELAVIAHFKDSNDCNLSTYRRIHQGLDKQAFQTSAGFIAISVTCAICFVDQSAKIAELT